MKVFKHGSRGIYSSHPDWYARLSAAVRETSPRSYPEKTGRTRGAAESSLSDWLPKGFPGFASCEIPRRKRGETLWNDNPTETVLSLRLVFISSLASTDLLDFGGDGDSLSPLEDITAANRIQNSLSSAIFLFFLSQACKLVFITHKVIVTVDYCTLYAYTYMATYLFSGLTLC